MKPFVKYPGGKTRELKYILPSLPDHINDYYEPFVGGGAVFFEIKHLVNGNCHLNDKSEDLFNLYTQIKYNPLELTRTLTLINDFLHLSDIILEEIRDLAVSYLEIFENKEGNTIGTVVEQHCNNLNTVVNIPGLEIHHNQYLTELITRLTDKITRMYRIHLKNGISNTEDVISNIETGIKNTAYTLLRNRYNHPNNMDNATKAALYYYIREFCYSSMFRFNKNGEFNVPYGGMSYNHKYLDNKIANIDNRSITNYLEDVTIENLDFFDFFQDKLINNDDFIFLDPPYDTEFSTYDQNEFTLTDQERLAIFLQNCRCKFMLIIKRTDYIEDLYRNTTDGNNNPILVDTFHKNYSVSFMNRNNKRVEHLIIKNY